jgi:NIPSNAP
MAIVSVSRWKVSAEQAMPITRQAAPILKRHGATSVRVGPCHAGPDTGQFYVATTYPDWATYGRALQAMAADTEWQRLFAEALKIGELRDRSLIVAEEL